MNNKIKLQKINKNKKLSKRCDLVEYQVSVIIPVYNAEKNLKNTVQSVINQSIGFENIELILVDDASTDDSKNIIKSLSKEYNNIIHYYSKKNHGAPGFGRNTGLKLATSNYIMFLDNDDEYDHNICKNLYETITTENADIACCDTITIDSINNIKHQIKYKNGTENNGKIMIKNEDILFFESVAVWNKIYKKEIIEKNNLVFHEKTVADDFIFTIEYYLNCQKMIFLKDYHGYLWKDKNDSLSHKISTSYLQELMDSYTYIYYQMKNKNKEKYMDGLIKTHISYLLTKCSYLEEDRKKWNMILNDIYNFEKQIKFNSKLDESWAEFVNKQIQKKHFLIATLILKLINHLRKNTLLRKINRKIHFKKK